MPRQSVSLRLDPEVLAQLKRFAQETRLTQAKVCELALRAFFQRPTLPVTPPPLAKGD
jgi:predicted transcriptional regulator